MSLKELVLEERKNGNVVFWALPDRLATVKLDDIVEQPADGLLYDLNRSEEVVLTFIDDRKWVNDFAVAQVIRKLVEQRDAARADTERINKLQSLTRGYGKGWILRDSNGGRGMRLHETSQAGASLTVRDAIDAAVLEST